ncbi:MAG TPA: ABC transporter ATP-binding protein [Blastocatellia bacterium]|nr:ABC transporter ATP-binding protein [Blastocatellia bacterium]
MTEPIFDVSNVTYHYDRVGALRGLNMRVDRGERIALLGSNGSGKSTLMRLLDGLYFPESGAITAFGEPLTEERLQDEQFARQFRRRIGFVFQNPDVQLFNPTVFDEIAFGPLQLEWPKKQIKERVAGIMDLMELSHLKDRPPHRLSGGEKKRVALASVIIIDPEVLLLDEPTDALDPRSQGQVIDFLVEWGSGNKTVLTATHNLDIVEDIADRCYILQAGAMSCEGVPGEILGDEALLARTGLLHAHRHVHDSGTVHSHPHAHQRHQH